MNAMDTQHTVIPRQPTESEQGRSYHVRCSPTLNAAALVRRGRSARLGDGIGQGREARTAAANGKAAAAAANFERGTGGAGRTPRRARRWRRRKKFEGKMCERRFWARRCREWPSSRSAPCAIRRRGRERLPGAENFREDGKNGGLELEQSWRCMEAEWRRFLEASGTIFVGLGGSRTVLLLYNFGT